MHDIVDAWSGQQSELAGVLEGLEPDGLNPDGWASPTPCEGWSVADVVLHLAQTNEMAIGSMEHRLDEALDELTAGLPPTADVDEGAGAMVDAQRHIGPAAVHRRWQRSVERLDECWRAADPHERVTWVAGQLSVHTLVTTRLAETWIHTTDVAAALEVDLVPTDRLRHVARLAWRTVPYAFARAGRTLAGPVEFDLSGVGGDEWRFVPDEPAITTVRGDGVELCLVAGRRRAPSDTALVADGPDAAAVLELARTYA
jgi:uncharacterized protein (TIGR03084 family)